MDSDNKQILNRDKLLICVDDFGLTPAINQAVLELAEAGKVNATSVIVDGNHLSTNDLERAVILKNEGKLSIGLHLNFTEILNPAQDEDLVAPINKQLIKSQIINQKKVDEIYEEIRRQFQKFEELFDAFPEFIDGHQHIHMLPGFFKAFKEFYQEGRLDHHKIWIRSLNRVHKLNSTNLNGASKFKNYILRFATKKSPSSIFSLRKELLGIYNFNCNEDDFRSLLQFWLKEGIKYNKQTNRGAVIMVHPSVPESNIEGYDRSNEEYYEDPIKEARVREYNVLKNLELSSLL